MIRKDAPLTPSAALPSSKPTVVLLVACVVFAAWIGTQVVAFRLAYQPNLGAWAYAAPLEAVRWWRAGAVLLAGTVLVILLRWRARHVGPAVAVACLAAAVGAAVVSLGPVYAPYRGILWAVRYEKVAGVAPVTHSGLVVTMGALLVALTATFAARPSRARRAPSTSHGSASWDHGADLLGPALGSSGVAIGRRLGASAAPPTRANRRAAPSGPTVLRFAAEGHLLTVAPTRSGKGVGAVIPNLLTYPGSVLVTDPKGENYVVTRAQRQALGHEVIALDPFGITDAPRLGFNPLDMIDPDGPDVSAGISHGRSSARNQSAAQTVAEKGRRLLTADEVMRLPADQQILLVRGRSPIRAHKLNYLTDREFAGLAADNPLYGSARAGSAAAGQRALVTAPTAVTP